MCVYVHAHACINHPLELADLKLIWSLSPLLWLNTVTKSNLGSKGLIWFLAPSHCLPGRKVMAGRNSVTRTEVEIMEECCFLACSACLLIQSKMACPRAVELPTVSWVLPHQSFTKKILPQTHPQAKLMEALSKLRFLFADNSSFCPVNKLTKN